jgi:hypothetical protein
MRTAWLILVGMLVALTCSSAALSGPQIPFGPQVALYISGFGSPWTCDFNNPENCGTFYAVNGTTLTLHYAYGGHPDGAVTCTSSPWAYRPQVEFNVTVSNPPVAWRVDCQDAAGNAVAKYVSISAVQPPPEWSAGEGGDIGESRDASWQEASTALMGPDGGFGNVDQIPQTNPGANRCKYVETNRWKGTWPMRRHNWLGTYWCWNTSTHLLTYRRSHTWGTADAACSSSNATNFKIGGGNGQSSVDVRSQLDFACQWWCFVMPCEFRDTGWLKIRYYAGPPYAAWLDWGWS